MPMHSWIVAALALPLMAGTALAQEGDGHALYDQYCSTCHQKTGAGIQRGSGMQPYYPPLAGNFFLMGNETQLATLLLRGRAGMPTWAALTDDQIAKIATYARSAWGNKASPITPDTIAKTRKTLAPTPLGD